MPNEIFKKENSTLVNVQVYLGQQGDYYVAYCPALELSSYGDSEKDAKEGFEEALNIFLKDTYEKGTFEKVLLKLGWSLKQRPKPIYTPPHFTKDSLRKFDHHPPKRHFTERVSIPL